MAFKDMFYVCIKSFPVAGGINIASIKAEAAILLSLNSCAYTPYCFGVGKAQRAIIMAYIGLSGIPVNLHALLTNPPEGVSVGPDLGKQILLDIRG